MFRYDKVLLMTSLHDIVVVDLDHNVVAFFVNITFKAG